MRVIGLTGSIACGKSTVSAWLKSQPDCCIIDGDLLSRELCAPGGAALPLIRSAFGDQFFTSEGKLNRRALGRLVFSDDSARETLDGLMAPLLQELTESRLNQARADGYLLCFLDFPLLFEKGYDALCDTVWCVYLPRELQLQRLMARDGLSAGEAANRIDAVLSSEEKASRSQTVLDNSGDIAFTLSLLPPLLEAERAQAHQAPRRRRRNAESSEAETLPDGPPPVSGSSHPAEAPPAPGPVMERPSSANQKKVSRRVPWHLPSWLLTLLVVFGFLTAGCITAQALMHAYLTRQAEKHAAEAAAIYANYPLEYRSLIDSCADESNLNPAFVAAIIRNESSFQPMAESSVGARGLMQLMPDTAEWIAGKMKISGYAFDRMFDPESNISFGCWYLKYLSGLFQGDPVCVACAYHAGQGQVNAWLSDSRYSSDGVTLNLDRLLDGPTKTYAGRVIRTYGIYQALYYSQPDPDAVPDPVPSAVSGRRR